MLGREPWSSKSGKCSSLLSLLPSPSEDSPFSTGPQLLSLFLTFRQVSQGAPAKLGFYYVDQTAFELKEILLYLCAY